MLASNKGGCTELAPVNQDVGYSQRTVCIGLMTLTFSADIWLFELIYYYLELFSLFSHLNHVYLWHLWVFLCISGGIWWYSVVFLVIFSPVLALFLTDPCAFI